MSGFGDLLAFTGSLAPEAEDFVPDCTCPECGQSYSGQGGGHCRGGEYGGCCRTFTSDTAAAAHRTGPYNPSGARRCLTEEELIDRGWRSTPHGWTDSEPMPEGTYTKENR